MDIGLKSRLWLSPERLLRKQPLQQENRSKPLPAVMEARGRIRTDDIPDYEATANRKPESAG
jgi:hypothetical protein